MGDWATTGLAIAKVTQIVLHPRLACKQKDCCEKATVVL